MLYAKENVKIFPGDFFGAKVPFIRLVLTRNKQEILEFLDRFKRFCEEMLQK